jgi:hypothetical protein
MGLSKLLFEELRNKELQEDIRNDEDIGHVYYYAEM